MPPCFDAVVPITSQIEVFGKIVQFVPFDFLFVDIPFYFSDDGSDGAKVENGPFHLHGPLIYACQLCKACHNGDQFKRTPV